VPDLEQVALAAGIEAGVDRPEGEPVETARLTSIVG
jgi:hypothetical protein